MLKSSHAQLKCLVEGSSMVGGGEGGRYNWGMGGCAGWKKDKGSGVGGNSIAGCVKSINHSQYPIFCHFLSQPTSLYQQLIASPKISRFMQCP